MVGCDIREGKPSICYAHSLESKKGTEEERGRLIEIVRAGRDSTTEDDIAWVIDFYRREQVLDFAQEEANRLAGESLEVLDGLPLPDAGKESFREVIRFVVDRKV